MQTSHATQEPQEPVPTEVTPTLPDWSRAPEVISLALRLGYQVLFHPAGLTLKRNPADPMDTWGFVSIKTALWWLEQKEIGNL